MRHILNGEVTIRHAFGLGRVASSERLEIEFRRVIHRCAKALGFQAPLAE